MAPGFAVERRGEAVVDHGAHRVVVEDGSAIDAATLRLACLIVALVAGCAKRDGAAADPPARPAPAGKSRSVQHVFQPNNRDHRTIEVAIRSGAVVGKAAGALTTADMAGVRSLDLAGRGLTDLRPLAEATGLEELRAAGNQVSNLGALAGLKGLKALHLGDNEVVDLGPLAGLKALNALHLPKNQVVDLRPLAGLGELRELDLRENHITDLRPLEGLAKLQSLNLYRNQIADLRPLHGLTGLRKLSVHNNPMVATDEIDRLRKALPACEIEHNAH